MAYNMLIYDIIRNRLTFKTNMLTLYNFNYY